MPNPKNVAIRNPTFVYDVKDNIAASYNEAQLLCVLPAALFFCSYGISLRLKPSSATIPLRNGVGSFKLRKTLIKSLSYNPNPVKCSICSTSENFLIAL